MIIRVQKNDNFTVLPNDLLRDARISYEARGLLAFILSFPNNWKLNVSHLVKSGGISEDGHKHAGKDKVYRILEELKKVGYLVGTPRKVSGKYRGYDYTVHETPVKKVDNHVDNFSEDEEFADLPDTAEPETDENIADLPDTANPEAYEELNYTKDYTTCAKKSRKKQSDGVVNDIKTIFAAFGSTYYHDGREAKACKELKDRFKADPKKFSQMILTFRGMRNTDKFYKDQPFSPSALATFWNKIEVQLEAAAPPDKAKKKESAEEIRAQQLQRMKAEMDEAGWPYNSALDSFVSEAYADYQHDKAKKEAGL